jgi:alpha-glucosidase
MTDETGVSAGPVRRWRAGARALVAEHARALTRIELIADAILRVRHAPAGQLAPRRSWQPAPPEAEDELAIAQQGETLALTSGAFRAALALDTGAISIATPDGVGYASDLAAPSARRYGREAIPALAQASAAPLPAGPASSGVRLDKALHPQERIYGCGQRFGALDRRGRRLAHWTIDINSPGLSPTGGNLYQSHPVLLALRPGLAWGLMLGSSWYSAFDLGAEHPDRLGLFSLGGELDYYLFAGPTPAAVVAQLTWLTGRPALPPLWALGYHQSRWGYRSADTILAIAREFRTRRLPIDAIHLDIDYMDGFRVFSWDRERFPSPRATVAALHEQNLRAVTIIDPGVKREPDAGAAAGPPAGSDQRQDHGPAGAMDAAHDGATAAATEAAAADAGSVRASTSRPITRAAGARYPVYTAGMRGEHFIRRPSGEPFSGYVWPGESLFPDFCRRATRRWWGDLHASLLDIGVDGIWCDMNEPAIVDRPFHCDGTTALAIPLDAAQGDDGESCHAETHNLYGTLMARATCEGLQRLRPQRRPWVLTRSASIGAQRWAASWMGDNASTWDDLRASLAQLANMGLSGSPHVGVDIGGFYGACDGELFARWIELGCCYPFMRGHAHHASPPQEPWAFGEEIEAVARAALERRYRLLPYLYSLAHRAHRSGEPILRPLLYDFPDRPELHAIDDQLMLGPMLMIAPVCAPGQRAREVVLPPGRWYDFYSGARVDGSDAAAPAADATARRRLLPAPLGRMPILVRGGSCLPLGQVRQSTREPLTELTVDAYPDPTHQQDWHLIEDAGDGWGDGTPAETPLRCTHDGSGPTLLIGRRSGRWRPAPRALVLRLHAGQRPAQVRLDAAPRAGWHWDRTRHAVVIGLADDGAAHRLDLV